MPLLPSHTGFVSDHMRFSHVLVGLYPPGNAPQSRHPKRLRLPLAAAALRTAQTTPRGVGVTPPFVKNCTVSREPEVTQRPSFCGAASETALIRSRTCPA